MTLAPVRVKPCSWVDGRLKESDILSWDPADEAQKAEGVDPALLTVAMQLDESGYFVRDGNEICGYVANNPELLPLLKDTRQQIERFFGDQVRIELHMVVDPESEGYSFLAAVIHSSDTVDEAMTRLDEFDEAWGLQANSDDPRVCVMIG